ncbi:DNA-processing protein DprA [Sulfuricystis multivorans]|uniref:DNA-processing protein DprA n=1 Tax=Sulfuricystis multivorans TaxID=2211108 RepID=UPI000F830332|nr:DNA-processing protein DprA [Sulfuricystis multivorans]
MDAPDELADWLRLTLIPGLGGEGERRLLQAFGEPAAIFSASPGMLAKLLGVQLAERVLCHDSTAEIEAAMRWAQMPGNRILTLADAAYPQALLTAADPPLLLYAKGRIELLNRPALAIVGSRNATQQGEANASAFARTLAAAGLTIVSGLAAGIDAAAHRGALQEPASTVAVVGTGCDRIYPARNEALAREIAFKGCIISEFPLGTPPIAANFPRRNRLIAGLSRGCLVVEAAKESGSLITARLAAEAGREVFAIPGSIHSPQSKGCHALIKQGAKLVESAQDILEELRWENVTNPVIVPPVKEAERDPILLALGGDPVDLDTLAARTGLSADALLARLFTLEMEGRIANLPGGRYQRLN